MGAGARFDKMLDTIKEIRKTPRCCGHCGKVGAVLDWWGWPLSNMWVRVTCTMCGAKASVRVKTKHTAKRIAAAACYALKKQYNKTVVEELMQ